MTHTEKRHRRKNSRILLIIIIMLLLLLGGVLVIRYQAHHQIGGLSRKPVIALKGDETLKLYPGEKFAEPGVTAKDYRGKDISAHIQTDLDQSSFRKDGTLWKAYNGKINYTLKDYGNRVKTTRKVRTAY